MKLRFLRQNLVFFNNLFFKLKITLRPIFGLKNPDLKKIIDLKVHSNLKILIILRTDSQRGRKKIRRAIQSVFGERVGASRLREQSEWDQLARRKHSDSLTEFFPTSHMLAENAPTRSQIFFFPTLLGACSQARS